MHAGPEHFGYVKRGDAADELVNIELDTLRHFFGRGGEYTTLEWLFGGKSFDGFWRSRCTVVEAKANFGHFFDKDGGEAKPFTYAVVTSWVALYREQEKIIMPAKPRGRLEWHFMEHSAFVAGLAAGLPAVVARVTPYVLGSI